MQANTETSERQVSAEMTQDAARESNVPFAHVAIGAKLVSFEVDVSGKALKEVGTIDLPSRVQYAWPHATLPILYAACADRSPDATGNPFTLCALIRDDAGKVSLHGEPAVLPARAIHVTTDAHSENALVAYATSPGLTMLKLNPDGTIGGEIPRADGFDFGTNPHQVRVMPSNDRAVIVARGTKGFGSPKYVEGGLRVVRYDRGCIENVETIAPDPAHTPRGFNPRHLDFHPTEPLLFVTLEAQNQLMVFRIEGNGIHPKPLFAKTILERPDDVQRRQDGGTVHVHPNGRYVYVANRNDGYVNGHLGPSWLVPDPVPVFPGGENSIAVFEISDSGEPVLIQHADTRGLHPRTFALDPTGRLLIAGNLAPTVLRDGDDLRAVPANIAVFGINGSGKLHFERRHDLDVGNELIWWSGIV